MDLADTCQLWNSQTSSARCPNHSQPMGPLQEKQWCVRLGFEFQLLYWLSVTKLPILAGSLCLSFQGLFSQLANGMMVSTSLVEAEVKWDILKQSFEHCLERSKHTHRSSSDFFTADSCLLIQETRLFWDDMCISFLILCSLALLKVRSLKLVSLGLNQDTSRALSLWGSREESVSFPFPASGGSLHALSHGLIPHL